MATSALIWCFELWTLPTMSVTTGTKWTHQMDRARVRRSTMGLVAGFAIAILFLAGSVWLVSEGHGVEGTVLGTIDLVALVALVALFVIGRKDSPGQ